jgi:hypothetical protein
VENKTQNTSKIIDISAMTIIRAFMDGTVSKEVVDITS